MARIVVGAAVVRDGRVLAARRTRPAAAAGRWELPGGAVEPGEDEAAALARELREELDLDVVVGDRVGPEVALPGERVLRIRACRTGGEPTALEHDALRWVAPEELEGLDWLDADRAVLPDLGDLLRQPGPSSTPS
ncbi:(deoxy)nucleoside triphosphate pyrophosphohydrolase [Actinomycetospora cinnamomea]|uniref:8-oxo-dGTP diphosphatase n=1 Tax=Actinomycetospora cinnamomea TaxID=663609 RepID=A0A2U1F8V1_9PSEU|nr:NUDIX domain-containing protein [Actinomycetospora cinnamomea]PVZ08612.1 8-oxo-dGTP diphosphatase [Actinomycetospora cinnamomea]